MRIFCNSSQKEHLTLKLNRSALSSSAVAIVAVRVDASMCLQRVTARFATGVTVKLKKNGT